MAADAVSDRCVYLDSNATTPLAPSVLDAITSTLRDAWGNPSSAHAAGRAAKEVVDGARAHLAALVGATGPGEVVFTSGGTESNNQIIRSAVSHAQAERPDVVPHVVSSTLEHDSVIGVLQHLVAAGEIELSLVDASDVGRVRVADVEAALRPTATALVSIMLANNETGVLQPLKAIAAAVRAKAPHCLVHTDAAQIIGKLPVSVEDLGVDYLTVVGHKFYAPRIGALYCRGLGTDGAAPLLPLLFGGGQERAFRPGTENTGMIAGLGEAARLVVEHLAEYEAQMRAVRDHLEASLLETFGTEAVVIHCAGSERLPNTCNFSFRLHGRTGRKVLTLLAGKVSASVGAACHSSSGHTASPILLASGVPPETACNAMRWSVGRETTAADIDFVLHHLKAALDAEASS